MYSEDTEEIAADLEQMEKENPTLKTGTDSDDNMEASDNSDNTKNLIEKLTSHKSLRKLNTSKAGIGKKKRSKTPQTAKVIDTVKETDDNIGKYTISRSCYITPEKEPNQETNTVQSKVKTNKNLYTIGEDNTGINIDSKSKWIPI